MKGHAFLCSVMLSWAGALSFGADSTLQISDAIFQAGELPVAGRVLPNVQDNLAYFMLTCTPPPTSAVTVRVKVGFLTASPADFHGGMLPEEIEVVLEAGASEVMGHIGWVRDDGVPEEDEALSLSLGSISGPPVLGERTNATVIIKNAAPALLIARIYPDSASENAPQFDFEIVRLGDTNAAVSVDHRATRNSTALAGVDFIPGDGRVWFAPGETRKPMAVALRDNGEVSSPLAPRRMIELEIFNPSTNATILDPPLVQHEIWDNEIAATLDLEFSPSFDRFPAIHSVAVQPDGRILLAGASLFISNTQRALVRLNADGSLDSSFRPDIQSWEGASAFAATQSDGRIVVRYDDYGLVRLLPDGGRDDSFAPRQMTLDKLSSSRSSVTILRNGKVLLGIERVIPDEPILVLNGNGSEDEVLQGRLSQYEFFSLVEMPDGRFLLMMNTAWTDERRVPPLVRLQADGSADPTFQPPGTILGVPGSVLPLLDGTIIAESLESSNRVRLVRLLPDGNLDPIFSSLASEGRIVPLFEKEGKVYVWKVPFLLRLVSDGSPDPSFSALLMDYRPHHLSGVGFGPPPQAVPHRDGIVCWGGSYFGANGVPRPLIRITPDAPAGFMFRTSDEFAFVAPTRAFEAEGSVEITVVRTGNTSQPASVRYRTQDGTALDGQSYVAAAGTIPFAPFQTDAVIRITLPQDEVFRGRPYFYLELFDPSIPARLDPRRQIVVHDREPGIVTGRTFTWLDGRKEMEFDVTGLGWNDGYRVGFSTDLIRWNLSDRVYHLGPGPQFGFGQGPWFVRGTPALLEVGPTDRQFYRMIRP